MYIPRRTFFQIAVIMNRNTVLEVAELFPINKGVLFLTKHNPSKAIEGMCAFAFIFSGNLSKLDCKLAIR